MARRKKLGAAEVLGLCILGLLGLLASIPREIWIAIGIAVAIGGLVYICSLWSKSQGATSTVDDDPPARRSSAVGAQAAQTTVNLSRTAMTKKFSDDDIPVNVAPRAAVESHGFRIPSRPKEFGTGTWFRAGQPVTVAGVMVPGGMIYVGTTLKTPLGNNDPCLIDPSKSVAKVGDYTERQTGYWPSYSDISSSARRAYLNWLADGRQDPEADIGYVFMFFYGLERRAIVDASKDSVAQGDWPAITSEIRRLLEIYGEKSNSFRRYAGELLSWVSLAEHPQRLYENPAPSFPKTFELPLYIRLALGQAAVDGAPVPDHLALAWAKLDPNIGLRTPATRCREQFDRLFAQKYAAAFGDGLVLPCNRTKLKFVYRPASLGLQGYGEIRLGFGDTPDVTAVTAPLKKLQQVVETTTKELEPFSRFVGKNPESSSSLEGLLQLPATLWPERAQQTLDALKARMGGGMMAISFQDLLASLDAKSTLNRDRTLALARALESVNIGIEPDILAGAKLPKPEEHVVLFAAPPGDFTSRGTPAYHAAALTLQLASAVAAADGEFSAKELSHLREQVVSWTHLAPSHTRRLLAHLRLLMQVPASLTALKKKLEPLDAAARETIAAFMATVAQSDGMVSPDEVKTLEKVYKALGIDAKKVFSDVHAMAAGQQPARAGDAKPEERGFRLDAARIAALQQDTEKVSALLSSIFTEEVVTTELPEPEVEAESAEPTSGLLGLDEEHTALARMLLSRPQWSREELLDVAADLDLMLDGAIEHMNEAAFDAHDMLFTEGEDPVTINPDILEKLDA